MKQHLLLVLNEVALKNLAWAQNENPGLDFEPLQNGHDLFVNYASSELFSKFLNNLYRGPEGPVPITSQAQAATMLAEAAAILEQVKINGILYFEPQVADHIILCEELLNHAAMEYQEGNIPMLIHFKPGNVVVSHHGLRKYTVLDLNNGKVVVLDDESVLSEFNPSELQNVYEVGNIGFVAGLTLEQAQERADRGLITFYPDTEPGIYSGQTLKQKTA